MTSVEEKIFILLVSSLVNTGVEKFEKHASYGNILVLALCDVLSFSEDICSFSDLKIFLQQVFLREPD